MDEHDRSLAGFTMLAHGVFHTYELSIPLFVVVWLEAFSVSAFALGTVVGIGYGLIGVGALPGGIVADRYGSRALIVASVVGMGGGFFLLALAPNVYALGAAIVLWGTAASVYHPAGLSMISRRAAARGQVFAYHGVGGNVGTALGPLIAAVLLVFFEWRLVVVALTGPAVAAALLGSAIGIEQPDAPATGGSGGSGSGERPPSGGDGREGGSISDRSSPTRGRCSPGGFALALCVVMLYGVYYRGLLTFMPNMIADLPRFGSRVVLGRSVDPSQYVYTGLLMVGILGQYAGGRATDLVEPEHALASVLTALGVLAVVFLPSAGWGVVPFLVVCGVLGFCLYATAPIYQVLIAEHASADVHGPRTAIRISGCSASARAERPSPARC